MLRDEICVFWYFSLLEVEVEDEVEKEKNRNRGYRNRNFFSVSFFMIALGSAGSRYRVEVLRRPHLRMDGYHTFTFTTQSINQSQ